MKQALETQLSRTFSTDMPEACMERLNNLSTGEHDKHILKWAGLGLPQPVPAGTEDVSGTTKAKKKRRTGRRTYTAEQCCDENSEEVAKLCKVWCQMFKEDVSKVKTLCANTREFIIVCMILSNFFTGTKAGTWSPRIGGVHAACTKGCSRRDWGRL